MNGFRILVGKSEWKRPLGRSRRRWEGNIKMDLREIGWCDIDRIDLAQDGDQWRAYEDGSKPSGFIKCWEILAWLRSWEILKKGSAP
jgi:hypothetical protein